MHTERAINLPMFSSEDRKQCPHKWWNTQYDMIRLIVQMSLIKRTLLPDRRGRKWGRSKHVSLKLVENLHNLRLQPWRCKRREKQQPESQQVYGGSSRGVHFFQVYHKPGNGNGSRIDFNTCVRHSCHCQKTRKCSVRSRQQARLTQRSSSWC